MSILPSNPEVVVVGCGPVGLTLAIDLGQRGVKVLAVDSKPRPDFLPKMELCNSRSMEIFRRMGIANEVRAAGWDKSLPMDIWVTPSLNAEPAVHLAYPAIETVQATIAQTQDLSMPSEAYQRISQYALEPCLKSIAERTPNVTVVFGAKLDALEQDDNGVVAQIEHAGGVRKVRSQYLVGCDGASSTVRKQVDIRLQGKSIGQKRFMVFFRSENLINQHSLGPARHYYLCGKVLGALVTQNDVYHYSVIGDEAHASDPLGLIYAVMGAPVEADIISTSSWTPNLLIAERYQSGRVFIAGDAAHQVIPTGGFGMNTGVGDAIDLSWKLAAAVKGWAGPQILPSYEYERRMVGVRNVAASEFAATGSRDWRVAAEAAYRTNGGNLDDALKRFIVQEQRKSHDMQGVESSYSYASSPIVGLEAAVPQGVEEDRYNYQSKVVVGARLPHVWLSEGVSIHDRMGPDYTLICFGDQEGRESMERAFAKLRAPLEILTINDERIAQLFGTRSILVRPDLHVVWNGDQISNPTEIAEIVTGHGRRGARVAAAKGQPCANQATWERIGL